ncbi:MAG: hypothetical protein ABIQ95_01330 [Bdellovibrionia bacterium]
MVELQNVQLYDLVGSNAYLNTQVYAGRISSEYMKFEEQIQKVCSLCGFGDALAIRMEECPKGPLATFLSDGRLYSDLPSSFRLPVPPAWLGGPTFGKPQFNVYSKNFLCKNIHSIENSGILVPGGRLETGARTKPVNDGSLKVIGHPMADSYLITAKSAPDEVCHFLGFPLGSSKVYTPKYTECDIAVSIGLAGKPRGMEFFVLDSQISRYTDLNGKSERPDKNGCRQATNIWPILDGQCYSKIICQS